MNITRPEIKQARRENAAVLIELIAKSGIKKCAVECAMGISRGYLSQLTKGYRPTTEKRITQARAAIEALKS
jgi:hypothetical protein